MSDLLRAGTYKTAGLTDTGSFQQISGKSSIAEVRRADGLAVDRQKFFLCAGGQRQPLLGSQQAGDLHQFLRRVIFKRHIKGDAGAKPRVSIQEVFHFIRVSGKNDYGAASGVFHFLNDGIDRFVTETPLFVHQRISWVLI